MKGSTWNANGFVTLDPAAKTEKITAVIDMMRAHALDYIVVTETHSIPSRCDWYEQHLNLHGLQVFWSHKSTRSAGVAIIIKDDFLKHFVTRTWHHVEEGHVIVVRMTDNLGRGLDIFGCYFPADYASHRKATMDKVHNEMNAQSHTVILGDN